MSDQHRLTLKVKINSVANNLDVIHLEFIVDGVVRGGFEYNDRPGFMRILDIAKARAADLAVLPIPDEDLTIPQFDALTLQEWCDRLKVNFNMILNDKTRPSLHKIVSKNSIH